ncbi:spore coat protein [Brevibacillus humidisoli]|uniref:spore coat protein n=1 Tax=Brevibacillus humidisoli TaxID=2895522 RepID=UPI001E5D9157|nr:spore coat protein [Brevibacillus humidisoli]UFJ42054.1 spore coat protein [Brevibacillus humidisoli]
MQQMNQIKNPKPAGEPKVKGPEMNDRDRLNDVLATEKYLTDSLNVAAREASHDQLHHDMITILNETHRSQRSIFNMMFQKGWYALEAEDQQKLSQAFQQFNQYSTQFPYQNNVSQ